MRPEVLGFVVGVVLGLCTVITLAVLYVIYLVKVTPRDEPLATERAAVDDSLCLDCGPTHVGRDGRCSRCGSNTVDHGRPETDVEASERRQAYANDFRARQRARRAQVVGGIQ